MIPLGRTLNFNECHGKGVAAAMAVPEAFWTEKKKLVLFLQAILHRHSKPAFFSSTLTSNINTKAMASDLPGEQPQCNGIGNVNFTVDVRKLCKQNRLKEALHILRLMDEPDFSTYASLLQGCINIKALPEGKLVHAYIIRTRFKLHNCLCTKVLIIYAKCGSLVDARRVLDEMPTRNEASWSAMIAAYARQGNGQEALTLFYEMQRSGNQPNQFTFASVLPACANQAALKAGKEVHASIIVSGFQSDIFVNNALVDMYAKCGQIQDAHHVFDKMPQRNVVSWSAMIAAFARRGHSGEALTLFHQMQRSGIIPDQFAFASVLPACGNMAALEHGKEVHREIIRSGVQADIFVGNGVVSNLVTFASVLPACANLAALQQGKEVHEDIIRKGLQYNVFVGSALIDMYAKCGSIKDARTVFNKMPQQNVVSWNSMIVGYAIHGCGKEALQLFEQMQHSGMEPDHITFVGVLSACCHAGLVDDGWQYFDRMSQDYHITPGGQHYCCMVDLLGRAGHLDEAHNFINKMPIKPSPDVWGSLLAACRNHTNIELGERVAERLFELDPENSAHYVLLSNMYARAGRWEDKEKVRKMMKDRRVKKTPGHSWIEVNNKVYAFLVGDRSHPQTREIYAKLDGLFGQMKEAGYTPDMNFVFHDVEDEQKEHTLCHHSEKLAIAFGLINTSPGTPIRIVKNLRVCGDCHSATKFISQIVARDIIVRDAIRFHHFKDGQCSCGGYWEQSKPFPGSLPISLVQFSLVIDKKGGFLSSFSFIVLLMAKRGDMAGEGWGINMKIVFILNTILKLLLMVLQATSVFSDISSKGPIKHPIHHLLLLWEVIGARDSQLDTGKFILMPSGGGRLLLLGSGSAHSYSPGRAHALRSHVSIRRHHADRM
eukprot:Gb_14459 [translate_table: standard]